MKRTENKEIITIPNVFVNLGHQSRDTNNCFLENSPKKICMLMVKNSVSLT